MFRYLAQDGVAVCVVMTDGHSFDRMRSEKAPFGSLPVPVKNKRLFFTVTATTRYFTISYTNTHEVFENRNTHCNFFFQSTAKCRPKSGFSHFVPPRPVCKYSGTFRHDVTSTRSSPATPLEVKQELSQSSLPCFVRIFVFPFCRLLYCHLELTFAIDGVFRSALESPNPSTKKSGAGLVGVSWHSGTQQIG